MLTRPLVVAGVLHKLGADFTIVLLTSVQGDMQRAGYGAAFAALRDV
jgi:hypothetical protein